MLRRFLFSLMLVAGGFSQQSLVAEKMELFREVTYEWKAGDSLSQVLYRFGLGRSAENKIYGRHGWLEKNLKFTKRPLAAWASIQPGQQIVLILPALPAAKSDAKVETVTPEGEKSVLTIVAPAIPLPAIKSKTLHKLTPPTKTIPAKTESMVPRNEKVAVVAPASIEPVVMDGLWLSIMLTIFGLATIGIGYYVVLPRILRRKLEVARTKAANLFLLSFAFEDALPLPSDEATRAFLLSDWSRTNLKKYGRHPLQRADQRWQKSIGERLAKAELADLVATTNQSGQGMRLWDVVDDAPLLLNRALEFTSQHGLRRMVLGRLCQLAILGVQQERLKAVHDFVTALMRLADTRNQNDLVEDLVIADRFLREQASQHVVEAGEPVPQFKAEEFPSLPPLPLQKSRAELPPLPLGEESTKVTNIPLPIQDEDLAKGVLAVFVESLDQQIATLHLALENRDFVTGREAAEKLRQSAMENDAREVAGACATIIALIEVESPAKEIDAALYSLASLGYEIKERKRGAMALKASA